MIRSVSLIVLHHTSTTFFCFLFVVRINRKYWFVTFLSCSRFDNKMGGQRWHAYYGCSNCKKVYDWINSEKDKRRPCPRCRTQNGPLDEVSTSSWKSSLLSRKKIMGKLFQELMTQKNLVEKLQFHCKNMNSTGSSWRWKRVLLQLNVWSTETVEWATQPIIRWKWTIRNLNSVLP